MYAEIIERNVDVIWLKNEDEKTKDLNGVTNPEYFCVLYFWFLIKFVILIESFILLEYLNHCSLYMSIFPYYDTIPCIY